MIPVPPNYLSRCDDLAEIDENAGRVPPTVAWAVVFENYGVARNCANVHNEFVDWYHETIAKSASDDR